MEQDIKPKGRGGRKKGKRLPHLQKYPGILFEIRLAWSRMKAQAKYRKEAWDLSWEDFQTIWDGKWHLRGTIKGTYCLTRKDWDSAWSMDNVEIIARSKHWSHKRELDRGKRRGPYGPRKNKTNQSKN